MTGPIEGRRRRLGRRSRQATGRGAAHSIDRRRAARRGPDAALDRARRLQRHARFAGGRRHDRGRLPRRRLPGHAGERPVQFRLPGRQRAALDHQISNPSMAKLLTADAARYSCIAPASTTTARPGATTPRSLRSIRFAENAETPTRGNAAQSGSFPGVRLRLRTCLNPPRLRAVGRSDRAASGATGESSSRSSSVCSSRRSGWCRSASEFWCEPRWSAPGRPARRARSWRESSASPRATRCGCKRGRCSWRSTTCASTRPTAAGRSSRSSASRFARVPSRSSPGSSTRARSRSSVRESAPWSRAAR